MASERTSTASKSANKSSEPQEFWAWMAEAQRILERKHGVNPQVVSWRQWRDAFIKHLSPEEAADHAVTAVHNAPDR